MDKQIRIVVLGSLNYDTVLWADRLPQKGETVVGYKSGNFAGGKGANQAVEAARLGADVAMIGRMGTDAYGDFVENSLRASGVRTEYIVRDSAFPTGNDAIHVDANGDNAIIICLHANMHIEKAHIDRAAEDIKKADIFLTQLETNIDAVLYALKLAKAHGVMTILNPAPAGTADPEVFGYADYVTPNETEAEYFTKIYRAELSFEGWIEKCSRRLMDMGAKNVVITLGEKGASFCSAKERFVCPPYKIDAVDSTAAGDAFNAGFACALARGGSIQSAMAYGCACGALTAQKPGAQEALPCKADVDKFIAGYGKA